MGLIFHRLRTATKAVGAKLVIDVTQAAGVIQISVRKWKADLLVCSGYKWLGGHGGIAFAIFSDALLSTVPLLAGLVERTPLDTNAKQLLLSKSAARSISLTLSYISALGFNAALDELLNLGVE